MERKILEEKILEAKIEKLYVNHRGNYSEYNPGNGFRYTRLARMTLWALTDTKHYVWLETIEGLNHDRIGNKQRDYLDATSYKLGDTINYVLKNNKDSSVGFIRKPEVNSSDKKE